MDTANPFFHRGAIHHLHYFFDRRRESDQALSLLHSAQSVSIVGPRRIGKTSLLFHLTNPDVLRRHGLAPEQHCCVYVDCESWGRLEPSDLYALLLEEMNDALIASGRQVEISAPLAAPMTYRAFERAIRAVVRQGIQLIFALDEFESLSANPYLDADFFSSLRGLATRHGVAYLTASTEPLLVLTYIHTSVLSSPFFNFFAQIRLYPFSRTEAEELLVGLAMLGGVRFNPTTVAFLLDLAGPHPLLLQIAGYHAYELITTTSPSLDEAGAARVRRHFLTEAEAHWTYAWRNLMPNDQRLLALLPVAGKADAEGVQRLERAGLVLPNNGEFVPLSQAFEEFVRRQAVSGLLQAPPVTLDPEQRLALLHGQPLSLSPTEFDLLACLVARAGQVVPQAELESQVWHDTYVEDPDRLKTALKTLRRMLGADAGCVQNVRGVGYKFVARAS